MAAPSPWAADETVEFVSLDAGGQKYCIEITQIREIRRWSAVTILPYADPTVLGVMNLRGAVIPIVDVAARLGMGSAEPGERHVVIVVALGDRTIGLLVNSVVEILTIKGGDIKQTPNVTGEERIMAIQGLISVDEEMSRILHLEAFLPDMSDLAA
jgi:purine-binding chemotaxis protein CheW